MQLYIIKWMGFSPLLCGIGRAMEPAIIRWCLLYSYLSHQWEFLDSKPTVLALRLVWRSRRRGVCFLGLNSWQFPAAVLGKLFMVGYAFVGLGLFRRLCKRRHGKRWFSWWCESCAWLGLSTVIIFSISVSLKLNQGFHWQWCMNTLPRLGIASKTNLAAYHTCKHLNELYDLWVGFLLATLLLAFTAKGISPKDGTQWSFSSCWTAVHLPYTTLKFHEIPRSQFFATD